MNSYKMAFLKTKYANLYFKDRLVRNILKASFCHSSLLKDNKIFVKKTFQLFKLFMPYN